MIRPPLATTIASLLGVLTLNPALTLVQAGEVPSSVQTTTVQTTTVETTAEREAARRFDRADRIGRQALLAAEVAYKDKDYETAFAQFKLAYDNIPLAPKSSALSSRALKGMEEAGVRLAEQRITEGRYNDAQTILKLILDERYDPHCKPAVVLMARLETPGYYNKTITPGFRGTVEEVKKLMVEADGYYQTGRYDLAFKRCEQVLNFDRYNIAARKMEEKINLARDNYANSAYNETRSRAMWKLNDAWGNPVRRFGLEKSGTIIQESNDTAGTARIQAKLNRIVIPRLEFKEATIREAVEFLKKKSIDLDIQETDPARRGVNIVLKLESGPNLAVAAGPDAAAAGIPGIPGIPGPVAGAAPVVDPGAGVGAAINPSDARITVSLSNIPLLAALTYVTSLANLKYKIEPFAVSIVPMTQNTDVLILKEYKVRPGFIGNKPLDPVAGGLAGGPPPDATHGGTGIVGRLDAKEFLAERGITFPPGSFANYSASTSRLLVKNTQEQIETIDQLVESSNGDKIAAQVEIESKFVEITQNNLKELSFDWLLGQFNVGKGGVFAGGGTAGTQAATAAGDFPFVAPGNIPVGSSPITGGNRSGSTAITATAIDALLFGGAGATKLAPAIFALSGVFTDPQFQVVIRALNQKKGVDLLSAPRVTTKSGVKAVIEVIREFRYPTEFDPPQIPQNFGNQGQGNGGGGTGVNINIPQSSFPVTPTTPTNFDVRNTGVTLEVEPIIGPDGYTIDLNLVPQVVEFEGFINYGSPIQTTSTNLLGISVVNVLTPNVINQPIFSTRKVQTSVSIFDGSTVVLGGLMREDVQKVEDKVPLLGDIPLLGRLFRSSVDQHLKRSLVIFVFARLISPAGEPVHLDEETEEVVETLALPEIPQPELLPLMSK